MKKGILMMLLLCSFMIIGCKEKEEVQPYVKVGKTLTVTLPENSTTGYAWGFTVDDTAILDYKNDETIAPDSKDDGASGAHEFVFTGKAEGKTQILFLNKRDWEKEKEPAKKRVIEVSVDAKGNITEVIEIESKP